MSSSKETTPSPTDEQAQRESVAWGVAYGQAFAQALDLGPYTAMERGRATADLAVRMLRERPLASEEEVLEKSNDSHSQPTRTGPTAIEVERRALLRDLRGAILDAVKAGEWHHSGDNEIDDTLERLLISYFKPEARARAEERASTLAGLAALGLDTTPDTGREADPVLIVADALRRSRDLLEVAKRDGKWGQDQIDAALSEQAAGYEARLREAASFLEEARAATAKALDERDDAERERDELAAAREQAAAAERERDEARAGLLTTMEHAARELEAARAEVAVARAEEPACTRSAHPRLHLIDLVGAVGRALGERRVEGVEHGRREGLREAAARFDDLAGSRPHGSRWEGGPLHGASMFNVDSYAARQCEKWASTPGSPKAAPRDADAMLACAHGCGETPHRFRPSPEAGPYWRCSECGEITPAGKAAPWTVADEQRVERLKDEWAAGMAGGTMATKAAPLEPAWCGICRVHVANPALHPCPGFRFPAECMKVVNAPGLGHVLCGRPPAHDGDCGVEPPAVPPQPSLTSLPMTCPVLGRPCREHMHCEDDCPEHAAAPPHGGTDAARLALERLAVEARWFEAHVRGCAELLGACDSEACPLCSSEWQDLQTAIEEAAAIGAIPSEIDDASPTAPKGPRPEPKHRVSMTLTVDGATLFDVVREALDDAAGVVDDTVADEHREVGKEVVELVVEVVAEALDRAKAKLVKPAAPKEPEPDATEGMRAIVQVVERLAAKAERDAAGLRSIITDAHFALDDAGAGMDHAASLVGRIATLKAAAAPHGVEAGPLLPESVIAEMHDALVAGGCVTAVVLDRDVVGQLCLDEMKRRAPVADVEGYDALVPYRAVVHAPVAVGYRPRPTPAPNEPPSIRVSEPRRTAILDSVAPLDMPALYVPKAGDIVETLRTFTDDESPSGWVDEMLPYVGQTGVAMGVLVPVLHDDGQRWWWPLSTVAVKEPSPIFVPRVGDPVEVTAWCGVNTERPPAPCRGVITHIVPGSAPFLVAVGDANGPRYYAVTVRPASDEPLGTAAPGGPST